MWMIPLSLLKSVLSKYYQPILIGLAVIIYTYYWYDFGYDMRQAKLDRDIAAAVAQARQIEADNVLIGNTTGATYESDLAKLGDTFADAINGMRNPAGSDMPSEANSPRKPDANSCYGLPLANKETLIALAYLAEKQAYQLKRLQEWERKIK